MKTLLLLEATASAFLAAFNSAYFSRYFGERRNQARRAGAVSLALLNGGLLLESLLFLLVWSRLPSQGPGLEAAQLVLRTLLLTAITLVSLIIARGGVRR